MKALFYGATLFVAMFTILGTDGSQFFEDLRAENVGPKSVSFFLSLLVLLVAVKGLLATRLTRTLYKFADLSVELTKGIYISFSGGVIGWVIGLTLNALLRNEYQNAAAGTFLLFLVLIMLGSPLTWFQFIEERMHELLNFHAGRRRHLYVLVLGYIGLIGISVWSFAQMHS